MLNVPEDERIPNNLVWDYGNNEKLTDEKRINTLSSIERVMAVPYSTRARIITPILNKLLDEQVNEDDIVKGYQEERDSIRVDYGEI